MKTLEQHNADARRFHDKLSALHGDKPRPNGIECPKCKAELCDTQPMMTLTSNPPQKDVDCPKCGWRGLRLL